tara:strand:+ start:141 stop:506 length:366 start_codon:yes stop_codon:yes gene_type:complete
MKLQLKHLAPYLPYGLRIFNKDNKGSYILSTGSIDRVIELPEIFKPILRPLSDLATNNEVLDLLYEECQGIDENIDYWCEFEGDITNTSISFRASQILFKHHFDVFGLIPKGLAIDINTIT